MHGGGNVDIDPGFEYLPRPGRLGGDYHLTFDSELKDRLGTLAECGLYDIDGERRVNLRADMGADEVW